MCVFFRRFASCRPEENEALDRRAYALARLHDLDIDLFIAIRETSFSTHLQFFGRKISMRIAVVGGTGVVGRHAVEAFHEFAGQVIERTRVGLGSKRRSTRR